MSDTVTKKELAESLGRIADAYEKVPTQNNEWIAVVRAEINRLDPPKVEPEWPKQPMLGTPMRFSEDVEVYPAGVVGPVVEAARYHMNEWHGIEKQALHCTCRVADAIAAFDAAVRGE